VLESSMAYSKDRQGLIVSETVSTAALKFIKCQHT